MKVIHQSETGCVFDVVWRLRRTSPCKGLMMTLPSVHRHPVLDSGSLKLVRVVNIFLFFVMVLILGGLRVSARNNDSIFEVLLHKKMLTQTMKWFGGLKHWRTGQRPDIIFEFILLQIANLLLSILRLPFGTLRREEGIEYPAS